MKDLLLLVIGGVEERTPPILPTAGSHLPMHLVGLECPLYGTWESPALNGGDILVVIPTK
jgi:hypothetical protein